MKAEAVHRPSPEDEELASRRAELTWLEADLASQEHRLTTRKAELAEFEQLYLLELGTLNAQLREWKVRLANFPAEQFGISDDRSHAPRPHLPDQEYHSAALNETDEVPLFSPLSELKSLYREAARQVHPDTATNEADRARREHSMQEVNAAYAAGDEDTLRRIVMDSEYRPEAVEGSGTAADLVRVLRQLRQIRNRLSVIELEITGLSRSDMGQLKAKAEIAAREGRDLLAEMALHIQSQLDELRRRFAHAATGPTR
jgi:hypothetical protein